MSNFEDVQAFHDKFGLRRPLVPSLLNRDLLDFRARFMLEELEEFLEAHAQGDLATAADSLIDLVYVVMGTADLMGLPWQDLWNEVQRANMSKERVLRAEDSKRGSMFDVIKPKGWRPPDIEGVLNAQKPLHQS